MFSQKAVSFCQQNANTLTSILLVCYSCMQLQALYCRQSIWALAELVNILGGALGSMGLPGSISPLGPWGQSLDTEHEDFNSDLIYVHTKGGTRALLVGPVQTEG